MDGAVATLFRDRLPAYGPSLDDRARASADGLPEDRPSSTFAS
ncbi:hypothetical protein ACYOEI_38065 [Singulisphaera rosea]